MGHRALIAILDQGDAALDHFPIAKIRNAAGDYVSPTNGTMAAALSHMSSDGDGTLQVNLTNTDPRGLPADHGDLRDGAHQRALPRQGYGHRPLPRLRRRRRRRLPASGRGNSRRLPAPAGLAAGHDRKLAVEVANQTGGNGGGGGKGNPGASPAASSSRPSSTSTSTSGPGASPSVSPPGARRPADQPGRGAPTPAALGRFALPALLILGGLSALAGSSALLGTAEGGIRGRLRAFSASAAALGRSAWTRIRPNRTAAK